MSERCPSCEILYINGVRTHETGCPDAWKDKIRECNECGQKFKPKEPYQDCCGHTCEMAYYGLSCGCIECIPEPYPNPFTPEVSNDTQ